MMKAIQYKNYFYIIYFNFLNMFDKLTDTANILKAKITKDELEQKLVLATSEQNWQTPTNILHDIANAAYNYEKWQKINDFIWEKLKKKTTWRKILKALNLVDFLIKNGPPSVIQSFKYDLYQFKSFSDYQAFDGIDRGQPIREKAKHIVQLLSNEENLQEQREKARKIRQKMSGVTGGMNYGGGGYNGGGGYSGSGNNEGKYGSYNNKSYSEKPGSDYGGLGVYGDYSTNKSTLDKYKNQKDRQNNAKKPSNMPDITGFGSTNDPVKPNKPNIIGQPQTIQQQAPKKPFQKIAPRLSKPSEGKKEAPKPNIVGNFINEASVSPPNNNGNILGFDILGGEITPTQPQVQTQVQPQVQAPQVPQVQIQPIQVPQVQAPINYPVQTQVNTQPQTINFNQFYQQQTPSQLGYNYTPGLIPNQPQAYQNPNLQFNNPYPPYYPQQPPYAGMNYGYGAPSYPNPSPYGNQTLGANIPPQQTSNTNNSFGQISLSTESKTKQDDGFGNFQSGTSQSTSNVKWLTSDEKGLIDFSDFSNELKNLPTSPKQGKAQKGNKIEIDPWKW